MLYCHSSVGLAHVPLSRLRTLYFFAQPGLALPSLRASAALERLALRGTRAPDLPRSLVRTCIITLV